MSGTVNSREVLDSLLIRGEEFDKDISIIVTFDENLVPDIDPGEFEKDLEQMKDYMKGLHLGWTVFYVLRNRPDILSFLDTFLSICDSTGSSFWKTESVEKAEMLIRGLQNPDETDRIGCVPSG